VRDTRGLSGRIEAWGAIAMLTGVAALRPGIRWNDDADWLVPRSRRMYLNRPEESEGLVILLRRKGFLPFRALAVW
jgi:hypothetical protein